MDHELTVASVRQSLYMARTGLFTHVWRDGTTFVARAHDGRVPPAVGREHRLGILHARPR